MSVYSILVSYLFLLHELRASVWWSLLQYTLFFVVKTFVPHVYFETCVGFKSDGHDRKK
jgi:hypothetical protein